MTRTIALAVLFFSIFSCFAGCATTSSPKKFEDKNNEWVKLPYDPENPLKISLTNIRTKARIAISFVRPEETVFSVIEGMVLRISANGVEVSEIVLSDNNETGTFSFKLLVIDTPTNGMFTVKQLVPGHPFLTVLGFWPAQFHKEMKNDYDALVSNITDHLKSTK